MCILVVKETVYNGTSCKLLPAKFQAYKERGVFHFAKKWFDSLLSRQNWSLWTGSQWQDRQFLQNGSQFSATGWCLKSAWKRTARTRKSGHMRRCMTLLPELPEMGGTCTWFLLSSVNANIVWGNYATKTHSVTQSHTLTQRVGVINKYKTVALPTRPDALKRIWNCVCVWIKALLNQQLF